MEITTRIYSTLLEEMRNYTDQGVYVSDMALSSVWGDNPESDIPADQAKALAIFWDLVHTPLRDICKAANISYRQLACRFGIPQRTVTNWTLPETSGNYRPCPVYIRLMIAECLGLLPFRIVP